MLSDYLLMLVKAYNPNQYEKLLEHRMRDYVSFFLLTLVLCMVVFAILIIPATYGFISSMPAKTAEVEQLEISANVKADHSVTLLERPNVVLDLEANTTEADFALTNKGVIYPRYFLFGERLMPWAEVRDLKTQTDTRDNFLAAAVIFILPSIIFWFFLFQLLKLALIFGLLVLLGYTLPRIAKHHLSLRETVKLAVLALPSIMIMDLAFYPLAPLFWWGFLLTAALFFVGVALISEIQVTRKHPKV
jgi:hypothetical protein